MVNPTPAKTLIIVASELLQALPPGDPLRLLERDAP